MVKGTSSGAGRAFGRGVGSIAAAVALALGLTACGGGGGGSSSPMPNPAPTDTSTGVGQTTTTTVTDSTIVTTPNSSVTSIADASKVTFNITVTNGALSGAQVSLTTTGNLGSAYTASCVTGTCSLTVPVSELSSTTTVALTVTASGYKPGTINFVSATVGTPAVEGGKAYSGAVTLTALGATQALVFSMDPDTVYIGDGVTDRLATNQFQTVRKGLAYVVPIGSMNSSLDGQYTYLYLSAQIRGLESVACLGNKVTVFQSDSATGSRKNSVSYKLGDTDVQDALPHQYTVKTSALGLKSTDGNLYAEFAVDGAKCSNSSTVDIYDDFEFSAVQAWFSN